MRVVVAEIMLADQLVMRRMLMCAVMCAVMSVVLCWAVFVVVVRGHRSFRRVASGVTLPLVVCCW